MSSSSIYYYVLKFNLIITVIALLLILKGLFLLFNYWRHRKNLDKRLRHFNRPKGIPFLGNAWDFRTLDRVIPAFHKFGKEFNGVVRFTMMLENHISLSSYAFVEKILSSQKLINKSREYIFIGRWLNKGLLTSGGDKWSKRRKLLTPAFHFQILEQVIDVFNSASNILIQRLGKNVNKKPFDVYPYVTLCTLDVICESAMGIKINAQLNPQNNDYVECVQEMGKLLIKRTSSPLKQYDFFYRFSSDYRKELRALKTLHGTTDRVIQQRRKELMLNLNSNSNTNNEEKTKKKLAFLDLLLNTPSLTDADIREEVDTFMFEGHDTTASGISFALYNLAKYEDLQNKVFQEQLNVFSDGDDLNRDLTYSDLQKMKYLEMFIKESLRLFPPVPIFGRKIHEDSLINGVLFPKDTELSIFAYGVMRNADNFDEPDLFNPERFAVENKAGNIKPYAYIPFSAGPRNCIGQKMAMMQLKAVLSKIVRNFKIKRAEGPKFEPIISLETILKSANGIHIVLEKR